MKALIFHGTEGSPNGNWFPWLQDYLMHQGWQVAAPKLPTPEDQSLDNWILALEEQVPSYAEADVIIGHSCGGTFALRLLERNLICPAQTILVSTFIDVLGNPFDIPNKTFIDTPFDWASIKNSCDNITVFHGDDDPYVPIIQAEKIASKLKTSLNIIKDGGHLNSETGFTEFSNLLEYLDV